MKNKTEFELNITHQLPKIINKSPEEMDALLRKIRETNLNPEDQELVMGCIEFATWLPEAIREKNISIRNLQRMLFGEGGNHSKEEKKERRLRFIDSSGKISWSRLPRRHEEANCHDHPPGHRHGWRQPPQRSGGPAYAGSHSQHPQGSRSHRTSGLHHSYPYPGLFEHRASR